MLQSTRTSNWKNLIIVCCHAIYTGDGSDLSESQWLLQPFQKSNNETNTPSEHETFITHILAADQALQNDAEALLVFSGGETTDFPRTEARSYNMVFRKLVGDKYGEHPSNVKLEELATDSYQNLLFSIMVFRSIVKRYPEKVTVITHAFKERRFFERHAQAIKWPVHRMRIQGINPPFTLAELKKTEDGERKNGYDAFGADPHGARPPLSDKRRKRNFDPSAIRDHYAGSKVDDVVLDLACWSGGKDGENLFPDELPWVELGATRREDVAS